MNYFQQQKHDQKDIVNVFIPAHERPMIRINHNTYIQIPANLSDDEKKAWVKMKQNELNG